VNTDRKSLLAQNTWSEIFGYLDFGRRKITHFRVDMSYCREEGNVFILFFALLLIL
jgi:hypothetical protein